MNILKRWAATCALLASASYAAVPDVTVEPAPPGRPATATTYDLASPGYEEREFFISGTARSFSASNIWGVGGQWTISVKDNQPFKTRILVRYPAQREKFNGTVVVEWLNVTTGTDLDMDMAYFGEEILEQGYAWVGVTAQGRGLEGIKAGMGTRYASLSIPNDDFSHDIFAQASQAVRLHAQEIFPGITPQKLVSTGLSQAAQHMVTHANAIQPVARTLDGIIIHGRPAFGYNISGQQALPFPPLAHIRDDLGIPVLQFQSEDDVVNLASSLARQPDTDMLRTWEIAGTSHIDARLVGYANSIVPRDTGGKPFDCPPMNTLPTYRVAKAALRAMHHWMHHGTPAPAAPRIATTAALLVRRDLAGFTIGGIQQPEYAVPVARSGQLNWGDPFKGPGLGNLFFCVIAGYTTPLPDYAVRLRYSSKADYVARIRAAAESAVRAGFMVPGDDVKTVREAELRELPLR